jgi:hypothetical protein
MLVTCMGRVSCCTCCRQSITVHLRFNWPSVRFLHIRLALLHLMFYFLSLFIVFLYSLPPTQTAFFLFQLYVFCYFSSVSFYPPLFVCFFVDVLCFLSTYRHQVRETKKKEGKRNNKKGKKKILWLIVYL